MIIKINLLRLKWVFSVPCLSRFVTQVRAILESLSRLP